jgi:uncharacterized membrane protein YfcA
MLGVGPAILSVLLLTHVGKLGLDEAIGTSVVVAPTNESRRAFYPPPGAQSREREPSQGA